ncbi:hypothetical protein OK18_07950 [Chryseobacterium gallinarum]|uniref:Lanthionine synthetase C family protein n=1 Tax=Chryseobacterium gallinarum TaxID=1324352 RepID=A0A0G3M3I4_CHRGL|nr:lanthionine synthetase LanC family protein [Chryseobacterium gallinarum]AKK72568.1 hypothetical protein OK18_07950 [Chryseobacterium gallinarum]
MDIKEYTLEILDYINIIYKKNTDHYSDISLMNGITSLAIANLTIGIKTNNTYYIEMSRDIMENVLDRINTDEYGLKNTVSYCNGFAGICEALCLFSHKNIIDFNSEDLEDLDEFLFENAILLFSSNNPDYLHGAMGVLYYFSNRYDGNTGKIADYIESLIKKYQDMIISDEKGIRITNNVLLDQKNREFNFSLSHGLSGHVVIFLEIYKKYPSPHILTIVEGIEKYINSFKKQPSSGNNVYKTFFPTFIVEGENILEDPENAGYNSRLAWCYGELNYAMMYLKLNEVYKEVKYLDTAKEILETTIYRNNPEEARVNSPFFCHGASGLVALNMYFYKKTQNTEYRKLADYWKEFTMSSFPKEELYKAIDHNPFCLLEGGTGLVIGLSALIEEDHSFDLKENMTWERILLLN